MAKTDGLRKKKVAAGKPDFSTRFTGNMLLESASEGSLSSKRKLMSLNTGGKYRSGYLGISTPNVNNVDSSTMSKQERREFRKKLKMELDHVLSFSSRIEEREFHLKVLSESGDQACNDAHLSRIDGVGSAEEVLSVPVSSIERCRSFARDCEVSARVPTDGNLSISGVAGKYNGTTKAKKMHVKSEKISQCGKFKTKGSAGLKEVVQGRIISDFRPPVRGRVDNRHVGDAFKQCGALLKKLMAHRYAWVFNEPVDAVKLCLHDYHMVIRSPMDLGTIKKKLASGQYLYPQEFFADVRLTFTNAMKYNPKEDDVHTMAETLWQSFEDKWKSIEEKYGERADGCEDPTSDMQELPDHKQHPQQLKEKVVSLSKPKFPWNNSKVEELPNREMTSDEKRLLDEKIKHSSAEMMEHIIFILKKSKRNLILDDADIGVNLEGIESEILWELDQCLGDYTKEKGNARSISHGDQQKRIGNKALRGYLPRKKGSKGGPAKKYVDVAETCPAPVGEKAVKDNTSNLSSFLNWSTNSRSSSNDSDPARASGQGEEDGQIADDTSTRASPQEMHPPRISDTKDSPHSPVVFKEEPVSRTQLSPGKQLRAALLKGRFADTILKAKEKVLPLSKNHKVDPEKLKKEKMELERRQKEERARLLAEAKAAELTHRKEDTDVASELRRKREEEREAARLALQQMERTVEFNQEIELSKDLEILGNAPEHWSSGEEVSPASSPDGGLPVFGFHSGNPLEQLGLFMKEDYEDEEKQGDGEVADSEMVYGSCDVEEGEIDQ